jgi:hypothetical protein
VDESNSFGATFPEGELVSSKWEVIATKKDVSSILLILNA